MRIDLQRDHLAARRQRSREPDGAVTAERTDFDDGARALNPRQKVKQLALRGRDVDRR
jgi:hypothetical protein